MEFTETTLPGVILISPVVHEDDRGFFMETWQARRFRDAGIDVNFVQDNASRSSKGTLRGLHYQIEQPQGKLVRESARHAELSSGLQSAVCSLRSAVCRLPSVIY